MKVKYRMKFNLDKLIKILNTLGSTQQKIADAVGFNRSNISKYYKKQKENKPLNSRIGDLERIADKAGVDLSEFFDFDDNDLGKHHCDIPKNILDLTSGLKT